MSTYWFMFLKPNTVTLFHPGRYQRKKKYSILCSDLFTWPKRNMFKFVMHYKAGDIQREPNFLDDSTAKTRVLTAFEFNGCFSHSCVRCYHGNDWTLWQGEATFGHLCYTTQQRMDHLKRADVNVSFVRAQEWDAGTKPGGSLCSSQPGANAADARRCASGQGDICLLPVWWSSPWWEDTLVWFY